MGSNFHHERADGRVINGGVMADGVVLGVFFEGRNEGVIAMSIEEALDLASQIRAAYCPTCYGVKDGDHDECSDCRRNQAQKAGEA